MADVVLRSATAQDAVAGADLHQACWRETYGPIVDAGLLERRLADLAAWRSRWSAPQPDGAPRVLAVAEGGELVGFASAGPGRREDDAEHELYGLYVRAAWHGRGVGQTLLDAVVPRGPACSLWVLEDNARALAFYARNGFVPSGTRKKWPPLDAWELRLVRPADRGYGRAVSTDDALQIQAATQAAVDTVAGEYTRDAGIDVEQRVRDEMTSRGLELDDEDWVSEVAQQIRSGHHVSFVEPDAPGSLGGDNGGA